VRLDDVANVIVNAITASCDRLKKLCVADCVRDRIWSAVLQPTEGQRAGNQIGATFIFARSNFVNVL